MTRTILIALVAAASAASLAQAQTSGSTGSGVSGGVGAGRSGGNISREAPSAVPGGGTVVSPPVTGAVPGSMRGSAPTSQPVRPLIDTNQAQQPGPGIDQRRQ